MQPTFLAAFFALSGTAIAMSAAALALLVIGLWAAKNDLAQARGLDKIVALANLCFAIPLAEFGAEHLSSAKFLIPLVPAYMPWRLFWAYFVGFALIAASLSIGTKIQVRWSGLLFGIMMFLFVAMIHFPGAVTTGGRILWTIVIREMSFGGGSWVLAGMAMGGSRAPGKNLIAVGRVLIAIAAIFFGVQHFLHPLALPGVPLEKQLPTWLPARPLIDYLTGAFLIIAGVCFLLGRKTRMAATYLGAWIVLLVVVIYGPVLFGALADPSAAVQVEGLNYFADTLLFGGVILSLARAMTAIPPPSTEFPE
ncbi:MAG TPA: hypothetical protein VK525_02715 [Candidatus Saccharimonadales bacterium]|nr:hypothetical protein [Candidatus Saccharimonadales bacterium]